MSRKTTEWRRKVAQKGINLANKLEKHRIAEALMSMFPTRNVRTDGKMRLYDPKRGQKSSYGRSPAPGNEICTRPMSQDKMDRIVRSCGGFAMPLALVALVIMSMVAVTALHMGHDEMLSARAYRVSYEQLVQDEGAVNRAIALAGPVMDSLLKESVPGIPLRFQGVELTRYTMNPNIVTLPDGSLSMENVVQIVEFSHGRVAMTVEGNPGMWVPGATDDDPNPDHDPNENAWVCVWPNESKCWNSPNFGAHWLDSQWRLAPRGRRELW